MIFIIFVSVVRWQKPEVARCGPSAPVSVLVISVHGEIVLELRPVQCRVQPPAPVTQNIYTVQQCRIVVQDSAICPVIE